MLVGLVGLVIPVGIRLVSFPGESPIDLPLTFLASLVAGVSVFGTENASGSRRFLVHHGVAPGAVWWRKILVWGAGMGLLLGLMVLSFLRFGRPTGGPAVADWLILIVVGVSNAFAVGTLCGMPIRRRITAAMVGVLLLIALGPIQVALVSQSMVPAWTLVLIPSILLAISRAWAGDWLLEREGVRPWVKLAWLIAVPFGLLGASYIGYRAFGVPDVGPVAGPTAASSEAIPSDQDAAQAYLRASRLIRAEANFLQRRERLDLRPPRSGDRGRLGPESGHGRRLLG